MYSLVLRIRTLHLIEKLIENKKYSKKEFIKIIKKISEGENSYLAYLERKNDLKAKVKVKVDEAERLNKYLEKQLIRVKKKMSNIRK